jgi:hypothetical protein
LDQQRLGGEDGSSNIGSSNIGSSCKMCCNNRTECSEEWCWVELDNLLRAFIVRVSMGICAVGGDVAGVSGLNMLVAIRNRNIQECRVCLLLRLS